MTVRKFFIGKLQLGDTPAPTIFHGAQYVGMELVLPVRVYRIEPRTDVTLHFETSLMESWAEWQRHEVAFGEVTIGHLGDPTDGSGPQENHVVPIPADVFDHVLSTNAPLTLRISVGRGDPALADDFELRSIGVDGAHFVLGW